MSAPPDEWLLTRATVITMDEMRRVIEDGAVAVVGEEIVAVGDSSDLKARFAVKEVLDCAGCVIIPGLINAHTHVPMTLMRGLADDLRLDVWLYGYMMPVEREFVGYDFCRVGTLLACAEMIRSGVSTFCDMYYYEDEVARATAEARMRAVCAQTILKFPAPDATSFEESLAYCRQFIEQWRDHSLIVPAVGPHAAYTATPELPHASAALALEFDVPLHIHIAETALEVEESRAQHGMPIVPWLKKQDVLEAKVIADHCACILTKGRWALPTLAWAAAPGEKAPDMATRQVKVVGLSAVNAFFAGWYNDNKWVFAILVTLLMGVVGGLIALVTDIVLKVIGMDVSKIEHHE